jgi:hypothetical protein
MVMPFYLLWSRRDSNPRPNKKLLCFLRAYHLVNCRVCAGQVAHQHKPYLLIRQQARSLPVNDRAFDDAVTPTAARPSCRKRQ